MDFKFFRANPDRFVSLSGISSQVLTRCYGPTNPQHAQQGLGKLGRSDNGAEQTPKEALKVCHCSQMSKEPLTMQPKGNSA